MRHCAYATPVFTEKSNAWKQLIDVDQDCMHGQRRQRGFWPDEGGPTKCAGRTAPSPFHRYTPANAPPSASTFWPVM